MCHMWFHTKFVDANYLCFEKSVIDKAMKDSKGKHFNNDFKVEFFFDEGAYSEFKLTASNEEEKDHGSDTPDDDEGA